MMLVNDQPLTYYDSLLRTRTTWKWLNELMQPKKWVHAQAKIHRIGSPIPAMSTISNCIAKHFKDYICGKS